MANEILVSADKALTCGYGAPSGTRTPNPLIKRVLISASCRLYLRLC
jgi:hypothetical protein